MASLAAPPWRCSAAVRRLGLGASRPRSHLLRVRAELLAGAQSGAWPPVLPQAALVGLTSWPTSHRACSSNAGPSPPTEQASSSSGAIGAIAVEGNHVARHVPGKGLLIQAGPLLASKSSKLSRGSLVTFKEESWLCLFEIDRYWFAVPADGRHRDTVAACLHRPTPTQSERAQLHMGFSTGVAAVDVLAPLGRGQSMLICGPRASGKSSLAREILAEALALSCFTDAIRYTSDPVVEPVENPLAQRQLRDFGNETAKGEEPSLMQEVATLYAAVAEAEAVRDAGGHAILVLDTIAPLVEAWEFALQLVEAVLVEAGSQTLNKDSLAAQRRNFFAGLSERAANLAKGGSLTVIAVGETADAAASGVHFPSEDVATVYTLEDFAGRPEAELDRLRRVVDRGIKLTEATVATMGIRQPKGREAAGAAPRRRSARPGEAEPSLVRELQSLSDGQIVLSSHAAAAGLHPAVIVGATLSRFGLGQAREEARAARAGTKAARRDVRPPALQAVAAHLRTELALDEDQNFNPAMASASTSPSASSSAGAGHSKSVDAAKSAQLHAVKAALLQPPGTRLPFEETAALLLAACSGALDELPREQMEASLRGGAAAPLLRHIREAAPKVLEKIRIEPRVSEQTARELDVSVRLFAALLKAQ